MSLPPNRNLFQEYKRNCIAFVETGSYRGDGIQAALDAGFREIISIDSEDVNIRFCRSRFNLVREPGHVARMVLGDSATCLYQLIKDFKGPLMFWLDAHSQYLEDEVLAPGIEPYPLLKELAQIAKQGRTDHMIFIDDILHLTHPDVTGWSRKIIEQHLREINPRYDFSYIANPVKHNLLIACPPLLNRGH